MKECVLKKVSEVFEVEQEDVFNKSRKRDCVDARLAYFLSIHILGMDIHKANRGLPFTHTMPSFYVSKALELFTLYREYREKVIEIVSHFNYEACEHFASLNPLTSVSKNRCHFLHKPEKNSSKVYFKNEKRVLITSYTDEEIARINRACADAEKFFETYGKGHQKNKIKYD